MAYNAGSSVFIQIFELSFLFGEFLVIIFAVIAMSVIIILFDSANYCVYSSIKIIIKPSRDEN